MRTNILVIFTGGTIGCTPPKDGIKSVEISDKPVHQKTIEDYFLLTHYIQTNEQFYREKSITFETIEPLATDSSSMTIGKWNALISALKEESENIEAGKYGGIIITHGTDTLAYTASLIGVLLARLAIPVVFVSSNEHLRSPVANGHKNFADAVSFICSQSGKISGKYVAYSYDLKKTIIYIATQIKSSQTFIHRYESRTGVDFGYIQAGIFYLDDICKAKQLHVDGNENIKKFMKDINRENENLLDLVSPLESNIMIINPYVGLDYSCFKISPNIKAVLHGTYHSSTVCLNTGIGEEKNNAQYLRGLCEEKKIGLYFAPYESNEYADDSKFKKIYNSTQELAYAKLLVGYNVFSKGTELEEFLKVDF